MDGNANDGCLASFLLIVKAACWITAAVIAWNWVEPEGFGGFFAFTFVWFIIGWVFDLVMLIIVTAIANLLH